MKNNYLKNKIVVVTGSCGQLGYSMCDLFVKNGCKVIGLDKSIELNKINNVDYYELDIREAEDVSNVFKNIFKKYNQIDILINNAGWVFLNHLKSVMRKNLNG